MTNIVHLMTTMNKTIKKGVCMPVAMKTIIIVG